MRKWQQVVKILFLIIIVTFPIVIPAKAGIQERAAQPIILNRMNIEKFIMFTYVGMTKRGAGMTQRLKYKI